VDLGEYENMIQGASKKEENIMLGNAKRNKEIIEIIE